MKLLLTLFITLTATADAKPVFPAQIGVYSERKEEIISESIFIGTFIIHGDSHKVRSDCFAALKKQFSAYIPYVVVNAECTLAEFVIDENGKSHRNVLLGAVK